MSAEQFDALTAQLTTLISVGNQIAFCVLCTAIVGCFCFAAQVFRLVLQAKNSKNVW